jgi:hypothetical protein
VRRFPRRGPRPPAQNVGNFVIRLQFVNQKRFELTVLGRRVHIRQQPQRIAEGCELSFADFSDTQRREQASHRQTLGIEPFRHDRQARPSVHSTQWMIAALGAGNDNIDFSRHLQQTREEARGHAWHVTGDDCRELITCGPERGFETRERTASRIPVRDEAHGDAKRPIDVAARNHDVVADGGERGELSIADGSPTHNQTTLVTTAKAAGVSAVQDCRTGHAPLILSAA